MEVQLDTNNSDIKACNTVIAKSYNDIKRKKQFEKRGECYAKTTKSFWWWSSN